MSYAGLCDFLVSLGHQNKIPLTGWLKQQAFVFSQFGGWESHIKVPAGLVSSEGSLPGVQMAPFLLCPPTVGRESKLLRVSSHKDTKPMGSEPQPYGLIYP